MQSLSQTVNSCLTGKVIPFYWTSSFAVVITTASPHNPPWDSSIQSTNLQNISPIHLPRSQNTIHNLATRLRVRCPKNHCLIPTWGTRFISDLKYADRLCDPSNILEKGKAVPLQARSGPEGSRRLRFPDFMKTAQDGGKVVSLMHRPPLPPGNTPGTHFCWRLSRP